MMLRKTILLLSTVLFQHTQAQSIKNRPNIILIVSDDHGTADLGCYGNELIHTPNLDALAGEGTLFTRAYATAASCSPSRSVILTGLHNHANGQYGLRSSVKGHIYTLPNMLNDKADYYTARIGKFHIGGKEAFDFDKVYSSSAVINRNCVAMADSVKEMFKKGSQPFFLYFCTSDPHRGWGVVEDHPLNPDRFGNKPDGYDHITPLHFNEDEVIVPEYLPDNKAVRAELAQYYESVARMDQGIGKLFQYVKEAGIWDNTIIIYISDNGIAFPGAKTNTYEPALRLPCIVKPAGGMQAHISDALISWVDITPTILDFAGILDEVNHEIRNSWRINHDPYKSTNKGLQGISFKAALYNDQYLSDTIFASHSMHEETMYYPMRAIITSEYKLIWNLAHQLPYPHASDLWPSATWQWAIAEGTYQGKPISNYTDRPEFELYNLQKDPWEQNNLAYEPAYIPVRQKLHKRIKVFQEQTNDPWMVKWIHE